MSGKIPRSKEDNMGNFKNKKEPVFTSENFKITIYFLNYYIKNSETICLTENEKDSLLSAKKVMERELELNSAKLTHLDATIKMEQGKDIPLAEWAHKHGLSESYARQKARRGSLKTAHKVGRDWFINELEDNLDNRRKRF